MAYSRFNGVLRPNSFRNHHVFVFLSPHKYLQARHIVVFPGRLTPSRLLVSASFCQSFFHLLGEFLPFSIQELA